MDPLPEGVASAPAANRIGKYVCTLKLGAGAMGEVWKAWDLELRRWVALKFIKGADQDLIARFRREAQVAARFSHPNIAAIYDVGSAKGRPYLAMQYVEGTTLKRADRGDRKRVVRWIRDAARAVHHAHGKGVIHRDLKPENLMVSADQVMVMDFGLARPVEGDSGVSVPGLVVGTPSYMAPEQASGRPAAPSFDVWGLGATLYDLLAGMPPFLGTSVYDTIRKLLSEEAPPPALGDRDLENIVLRCLEKDPAERYATAEALAADLDRWLEGEPVEARGSTVVYRLRKHLAKRKGLAIGAALGALLLAGLSALLVKTSGENRDLLLAQLRESSETNLGAALELRRAGRLEGMEKFARRLEESCARAEAALPRDPEPHYRRGRMRRALLDDVGARKEQDRALAKDPAYLPSRYERLVLVAKERRARIARLVEQAWRPGETPDAVKLGLADPEARRLKELVERDLEAILAAPGTFPASQLACARGLDAWGRGDVAGAREFLAGGVPDLEEAVEALSGIEEQERRWPEAIAAWTLGIERDRGYRPHLEGRTRARIERANQLRNTGKDPGAEVDAARADADSLLRFEARSVEFLLLRVRAELIRYLHETLLGRESADSHERALEDCRRALELDHGFARAWRYRGILEAQRALFNREAGRSPEEASRSALEALETAARLDPADARILCDLVGARVNLGQWRAGVDQDYRVVYKAALEEADSAIARFAGLADAWRMRAQARVSWGQQLARQGQDPSDIFARALADYDESLRLDPDRVETWIWRAVLRSELGKSASDPGVQYRAGLADADEAVRRGPGMALVHELRGHLLVSWALRVPSEEGRLLEAFDSYSRALEVNPCAVSAWGRRAIARYNLASRKQVRGQDPDSDYLAALGDLAEALRLNPRYVEGWLLTGMIRYNRDCRGREPGQLAAAEEALRKAVEAAPGHGRSWAWLGRIRIALAKVDPDPGSRLRSAKEALDEAVRLVPTYPDSWIDRGRVHLHLGAGIQESNGDPLLAYEAARADLEKGRSLEGAGFDDWDSLATARLAIASWKGAKGSPDLELYKSGLEASAKALALAPGSAVLWHQAGDAHRDLGRFQAEAAEYREAARCYRKAVELDPSLEAVVERRLAECEERGK